MNQSTNYGFLTENPQLVTQNKELVFKDIDFQSLPLIASFFHQLKSPSCDYSIGGIYMWIDYFKYQYCIVEDTLFIKGVAEDNRRLTAFSLPIGTLPLEQAVDMLRNYCAKEGLQLLFSAITEDDLPQFQNLHPEEITEMEHWGDYLYSAPQMCSYSGKKLKQKRNHVNRFTADHPDYTVEPINENNVNAVMHCLQLVNEQAPSTSKEADYERAQVQQVLHNLHKYPFESLCLKIGQQVVGFTIGEVIGNTVHDHIEKSLHAVYSGINETLFQQFMIHVCSKHPNIELVNREDDAGEEGLRKSKLSYGPVRYLRKYDVRF